MTDSIVPPEDLKEEDLDPAPVEPSEEDDEELEPEESPAPPENETPEQLRARLATSEEARKKLYARLQREKSKNKPNPAPAPKAEKKEEPAQPASLTREEGIAFSKGYSEEEVEQAKKVAVLEDCTLTEAFDRDLFKDWKTRNDKRLKDQEAQLGASHGRRARTKKDFSTPGLSDEEHRRLFNDRAAE